jgi:hypothetical protein
MISIFLKRQFGILERNITLLVLNFLYVFLWGLTSGDLERTGFAIIFSLIVIVATSAVKEHFSKLYYYSAAAVVLFWISFFLELDFVMLLSHFFSVLFFIVLVVLALIRLAKAKKITPLEFLEAVNIYFFLGIIGSILFTSVYLTNGEAFNTPAPLHTPASLIYFSFVTLTSLGYGDISPASPVARSISIFLSFSGQIYIAMIISMLVGKYLNEKSS